MKISILKLATISILAAAIAGPASWSRADDTNVTAAAPAPAGPVKFYGPMTAIDTNAMTFTVGEQTFTVTTESELTKNGKTATLADAVVGDPARGSYTTGKDGKLDVTKARFGKKAGGKSGGKGGKKKKNADSSSDTAPATPTTSCYSHQPAAKLTILPAAP